MKNLEHARREHAAGTTGDAADAPEALDAAPQEDGEALSLCPWCGLTGQGYDESPEPIDYCSHD